MSRSTWTIATWLGSWPTSFSTVFKSTTELPGSCRTLPAVRRHTAVGAIGARLAVLDYFPVSELVTPQGNTLPSRAATSAVPFSGPTLEPTA